MSSWVVTQRTKGLCGTLRHPHTRRSWRGIGRCGHSATGPGTSPARPPRSSSVALPLGKGGMGECLSPWPSCLPCLQLEQPRPGRWGGMTRQSEVGESAGHCASTSESSTWQPDPGQAGVGLGWRGTSFSHRQGQVKTRERTRKRPEVPARKLSSSASWPA